jgi:Amt family ammonium transporter
VKKFMMSVMLGSALVFAGPALAEEAAAVVDAAAVVVDAAVVTAEAVAVEAPAAAEPAPVVDKGDVAWMMTATVLVLLMVVPGLALFYGGLVRSKNMLSVFMQVLTVFSLLVILWAMYGYSLAFAGGNAFIGTLDKVFLSGVTIDSLADTFSSGFKLPEYIFIAFQATFAGITGALIVGAFAERIKFKAVLLFSVLWFTFAYLPIAHMVWAAGGLLFEKGDLDFAGGTVVHINAGVAGLVGAYFVGKRLGFGKEALKPHNLTFTLVGAALLWVGWFGFNAGSALEANSSAALAFINTLFATAAAVCGWLVVESIIKGKPSALGGASGAVAGLVGITPAAGLVGPMGAIVIGLAAGVICVWGVTGLKRMLGADDALDVFGVHGIGGILGAMLDRRVCYAPVAGWCGPGGTMSTWVPTTGSVTQAIRRPDYHRLGWCGLGSLLQAGRSAPSACAFRKKTSASALDVSAHGERAYND